jgi:hypothetical protein
MDADDLAGHEKCLEMAGDMEPPLMGSNAALTGGEAVRVEGTVRGENPGKD